MRNDKTLLSREEEQLHGLRIQTAAAASDVIIEIADKFIVENGSSHISSEIIEIKEGKKFLQFNFVKIGEIGELLLSDQRHLTPTESQSIHENLEIVKEGRISKEKMITCNVRLVRKFARLHINQNIPIDDLTQVGTEGLMRAVEKLDPNRGYKFSTYARDWIKQTMNRFADDQHAIIVPEYQLNKISRIRKVQDELLQANGQTPALEIVAEECGMTVHEVRKLLTIRRDAVSLSNPVGEGGSNIGELIPDEESISPQEAADEAMVKEAVRNALGEIPPKDREVIVRRFALNGGKEETLEEIGKSQGISKEAVRLKINRITRKLATLPG
ncbi:MAG TPA: RNA polymerase sigma factor RpoD/SigA, partial [Acidimicrobiales bacterium]|nr:RNA polymerase sigma factor RpoD/SigA [Acidimicrobiales bacterium]